MTEAPAATCTCTCTHGAPVRRPRTRAGWLVASGVGLVATGGLVFQTAHTVEHGFQVAAWFASPAAPGAMTPWGMAAADALARLVPGPPGTGMEMLHLLGNSIFLIGLLALVVTIRSSGADVNVWARRAVWLQGLHVLEHVSLTLSLHSSGRASGLSTLFGVMEPGTALASTYRIWFHFVVNGVATAFAILALLTWLAPHLLTRPRAVHHRAAVIALCVLGGLALGRAGGELVLPDVPQATVQQQSAVTGPATPGAPEAAWGTGGGSVPASGAHSTGH